MTSNLFFTSKPDAGLSITRFYFFKQNQQMAALLPSGGQSSVLHPRRKGFHVMQQRIVFLFFFLYGGVAFCFSLHDKVLRRNDCDNKTAKPAGF